jgi:hypothetical protein
MIPFRHLMSIPQRALFDPLDKLFDEKAFVGTGPDLENPSYSLLTLLFASWANSEDEIDIL